MKRLLLACVAASGFLGTAQAADMIGPGSAVASYGAYDWSGFYLGGNGGYAWSNITTSANSIDTSGALLGLAIGQLPMATYTGSDRHSGVDGGFGGIQAGYNIQHGAFVYGVEADYQYAAIKGSDSFLGSPEGPVYETSAELRHFGTLRARLGYAIDTVLIYGTGGLAVGKLETDIDVTGGTPEIPRGPTFRDDDAQTMVGYAIGAGVEAAIGRSNWTVKGEYLYADFGGKDYGFAFANSGGSTASSRVDLDMHLVRLGLNYRF